MAEHSRCSSSSLKRRSLCSASCHEESLVESDHDTDESDRGTRLHLWMEKLNKSHIKLDRIPAEDAQPVKDCLEMQLEALGDDLLPDGTTVNGGEWFVEKRLECLSTAAPGYHDWGTVDLIVIYRREKRAFIGDYKFGGALIDHPVWNLQLQDYACNLWDLLGHDWCIEVSYFQPSARANYDYQPWHFSPEDLRDIAAKIRKIRESSYGDDKTYRVGPACQFCKASAEGTCWARGAFLAQFQAGSPLASIENLSPVELGEVLSVVKVAAKESERIYQMIRSHMAAGNSIPGYSYNKKVGRISGSPLLKGMKAPEITIKRTCANEVV